MGRFGEKTRETRLHDVVWTCAEEEWWVGLYWEKDAEDGVARKEETGTAKRRCMDVVKEDMAEVEVTCGESEGKTELRRSRSAEYMNSVSTGAGAP